MAKIPKRPRDPNQLAKLMIDIATGAQNAVDSNLQAKDPAAVEIGRKGGKKGGAARARALSPEKRSEIASAAAAARWGKRGDGS